MSDSTLILNQTSTYDIHFLEDFVESDIIGRIDTELLVTVASAPRLESKKPYVFQALDTKFKDIDFAITFGQKAAILYDEVLPSEILILIHAWLRTKSCNIQNIVLLTTHHSGTRHWWKEWCCFTGEKSFEVVELAYKNSRQARCYMITAMPDSNFFLTQKNIEYFFSFYGGGYATTERCYLTLRMLELNEYGFVDFIGKFLPRQEILDYAEHITYYTDQTEIELLATQYDRFIVDFKLQNNPLLFDAGKKFQNEPLYGNFQWNIDKHCFASVIRETLIDQQYSCITEKTLRTFLHHLVAIPTCYCAVEELESKGFWFPHDIFDYSYQNKKIYSERVSLMIAAIKNTTAQMSLSELNLYYHKNIDKFDNNAELAYNLLNTNKL